MYLRFALLWLLISLMLAGCATYSPLPLPQTAKLVANTNALVVPASSFATPGVYVAHINLHRPLDATAVAALAVLNDPALSAARAARGVAAAQSYAAGLLPWPQITLGSGRPDPGGAGLSNPWSLALEQNVAALLQHGAIERSAQASQAGVRLDVIWDEWQVAQQARLLYAGIEAYTVELNALQPLRQLYDAHLKAALAGARQHRVSQNAVLQAQALYTSIVTRLSALRVKHDQNMAALRVLLGLSPQASLHLALNDHPVLVPATKLRAALTALPHRRPDLMALAAAYRSADAQLRQAVAAQFPLIGVSLHRARDTEGVISNGVSLTLNLPFLNAARGEVAVARATRRALYATYQARLNEAVNQIAALTKQAAGVNAQLQQLQLSRGRLPQFPPASVGRVPFNTLAAELAERSQIAAARAHLHEDLDRIAIALDTLLGLPLDSPTRPSRTAPA